MGYLAAASCRDGRNARVHRQEISRDAYGRRGCEWSGAQRGARSGRETDYPRDAAAIGNEAPAGKLSCAPRRHVSRDRRPLQRERGRFAQMEPPGFQSREAGHGSAHLHARWRSGGLAGEGAFEAQKETRAAGGGQHIRRGRLSKSQLSLFVSIVYGKDRVSLDFLLGIASRAAGCKTCILLERTPQNA